MCISHHSGKPANSTHMPAGEIPAFLTMAHSHILIEMWNQSGMSSTWILWKFTLACSSHTQAIGRGMWGKGGLLLPVHCSSVHTQLWHIWKTSRKELLNQFYSPVNYNPAFLISSLHTMLFSGIQAKHGPQQRAELWRTNCLLMQRLPVRCTGAWLKGCFPWCRTEKCM